MANVIFAKEWTPNRRALFVDYRMRGMHSEWAVFWAMVDHEAPGCEVFSAEDVEEFMTRPHKWPAKMWVMPMQGFDLRSHMPPKELFDALAEGEAPVRLG